MNDDFKEELRDCYAEIEQNRIDLNEYRLDVERLRAEVQTWQGHARTAIWSDIEERKLLTADNERLRALLEPFGKAADGFDGYNIKNPEEWFAYGGVQGSGETTGAITVGDLRRARAALAEEKKG